MKKSLLFIAVVLCAFACKKNNSAAPSNLAEQLANTVWGGTYYDYADISSTRAYSILLNSDGSFDWTASNPTTKLKGKWAVKANSFIITFAFSSGAQNEWSGRVDGDQIKEMTEPAPAGFHINSCMKNP